MNFSGSSILFRLWRLVMLAQSQPNRDGKHTFAALLCFTVAKKTFPHTTPTHKEKKTMTWEKEKIKTPSAGKQKGGETSSLSWDLNRFFSGGKKWWTRKSQVEGQRQLNHGWPFCTQGKRNQPYSRFELYVFIKHSQWVGDFCMEQFPSPSVWGSIH